MKRLVLTVFLLWGCSRNTPTVTPQPVPIPQPDPQIETFEQWLYRTELVTCDDISSHAEGNPPVCRKLYEAFARGRSHVAKLYPAAGQFTMSGLAFKLYRPERICVPEKPYPLIKTGEELMRGWFDPMLGNISIAYEAMLEHEVTHFLTWMFDHEKQRRPEDMQASKTQDPKDPQRKYIWEIACHATVDDPYVGCAESSKSITLTPPDINVCLAAIAN